ncbi:MAG: hypothetical protein F4X18_12370 [Acidimicrobiia bacterium]|nr:hypothetical protein [bacterium]MXZ69811.1 hypothetical protein [Acidimicrobiia bacterium]MYB44733.1 hypothetical protein [Acidimicrobiia bacterium]MYC86286.1 hypothetical protein [Acidimicrobiia bacterium]
MARLLAAITRKFRAAIAEWSARREGARHLPRDIFTAARHIVGPTGYAWSGTWQRLDEDGANYLRSFDPKIPASVFLSPSDLTRSVHPVPLAERCIEDWSVPVPPDNPEVSSPERPG